MGAVAGQSAVVLAACSVKDGSAQGESAVALVDGSVRVVRASSAEEAPKGLGTLGSPTNSESVRISAQPGERNMQHNGA